tara:strand:- start:33 stop:713 length:681 start_codon:yes stop_codon:yes gene_type:complete
MTLPSSGAISLGDIRTAAGFSGAVSMGDLYRHGAKIPQCPGTTNIPTSGTIDMADFYSQTIFPSFLTFVAGQPNDGKSGYDGYSFGDTLVSASGSSTSSTMLTGSGYRLIVNTFVFNNLQVPYVQVVINTYGAGGKSDSSDVDSGNYSTTLSGKTLKVYNGAGTSGTVLVNQPISSTTIGSYNMVTNPGTMISSPAGQNILFRVLCNATVAINTLTQGNTYSLTIS